MAISPGIVKGVVEEFVSTEADFGGAQGCVEGSVSRRRAEAVSEGTGKPARSTSVYTRGDQSHCVKKGDSLKPCQRDKTRSLNTLRKCYVGIVEEAMDKHSQIIEQRVVDNIDAGVFHLQ